jgi:hypothetical protein
MSLRTSLQLRRQIFGPRLLAFQFGGDAVGLEEREEQAIGQFLSYREGVQ